MLNQKEQNDKECPVEVFEDGKIGLDRFGSFAPQPHIKCIAPLRSFSLHELFQGAVYFFRVEARLDIRPDRYGAPEIPPHDVGRFMNFDHAGHLFQRHRPFVYA